MENKSYATKENTWFHYTNSNGEKIVLRKDGKSQVWLKNPKTGKIQNDAFSTLGELVTCMKNMEKGVEKAATDVPNKEPVWTAGDEDLDQLIASAGFHYIGTEYQVYNFMHQGGLKLRFHTADSSSSIEFQKVGKIIAFDNKQDLKDYLLGAIVSQAHGQEFPGSTKATSMDIYGNDSILEYGNEAIWTINKLQEYFEQQGLAESVHFQYGNPKTGVIRVIKTNILLFAVGKKQVGQGQLWYIRQRVNDNPSGTYREYSFTTPSVLVEWATKHAAALTTWKSVKDEQGYNLGTPLQPTPSQESPQTKPEPQKPLSTPQYEPSGETYTTHNEEPNASLIWLNEHDEKLLNAMGFVRVPQENVYYKNNLGDIIKFYDTGKSVYIEVNDNGEVVDNEESGIPHMLKFIVIKYSQNPFSKQHYITSTDTDKPVEIQLNYQDTYMMEQLGFKWDEKQKCYIKFYTNKDNPKIHPKPPKEGGVTEGKKKKQPSQQTMKLPDPKQPEFTLDKPTHSEKPPGPGGENWEDFHEVVTCYDTGNAIWQLMDETKEIKITRGDNPKYSPICLDAMEAPTDKELCCNCIYIWV